MSSQTTSSPNVNAENSDEFFDSSGSFNNKSEMDADDVVDKLKDLRIIEPSTVTCYTYDYFMTKHKILSSSDHPERPERISRIFSHLSREKLIQQCHKLPSRFATMEELLLGHSKDYVDILIEKSSIRDLEELLDFETQFDSIYLCRESYKCACLAVGCLLEVVDAVCEGRAKNGFALVRPPGHHASRDVPSGFCIFNNVVVAAEYALKNCGCRRILILDWDVHHGNGTQDAFYGRKDVLYISIHRYDRGYFYPVKGLSNFTDSGIGHGQGYNVNVPWSDSKMGDAEYLASFKEIIMPICVSFNPDLVLVSAGFDAALGDPLGGYKVSPQCYQIMTHWLSQLAAGRMILVLEGGYNLTSISLSFAGCVQSLLGEKCASSFDGRPNRQAEEVLIKAKKHLQKFWTCLKETSLKDASS